MGQRESSEETPKGSAAEAQNSSPGRQLSGKQCEWVTDEVPSDALRLKTTTPNQCILKQTDIVVGANLVATQVFVTPSIIIWPIGGYKMTPHVAS